MAHVRVDDVALDFSLAGDSEHGLGDVHANPHMAARPQHIARDPRATTDIQKQFLLVARNGKDLECTQGQLCLDVDHARVHCILLGFLLVVEDVGRGHLLGSVIHFVAT